MSPARVVALLVSAGLACWLMWPSHPEPAAEHAHSTRAASAPALHGSSRPSLSAGDDREARVRVEGIVIDEQKVPIGGATVRDGARSVVAEADGTFVLDDVPAGTLVLSAEHGDWYGETSTDVDDTSDPVEIVVRRGSTLVLRVATADGAPIANAKVDIASRDLVTPASGTLRIRGLDPTGERFTVTADGFGSWRGDAHFDTEYPTAETAMTVTLASGAPVSGIVVDERGERVPAASVSISSAEETWYDVVSADERGEFTIPAIAAGKHTIYASSDTHLATPEQLIRHDGVKPTTGVVVVVTIGAELAGRVVDMAGQPVAGVSIRGAPGADTEADGRFVATGLDPGELVISAYTESRSSEEKKVVLVAGKRTEVQLVVRDSSLAGRVVDKHGAGIPEAQLVARTTDDSNTFFANADEYGAFDFGGIPPGDYVVVAQRDEQSLWHMPDDAKTIYRTGRRDIRIVLPGLADVVGRVVLGGAPVRYFGVMLTKEPDNLYAGNAVTVNDDTGAFAQEHIAPGTWSVVILGPGFLTRTLRDVVVNEGQTTDLGTIVVERGRTLTGRVTDSRGRPVAGAVVVVAESLTAIARSRVDQRQHGDATARTDANGQYELAGLTQSDSLRIMARTSGAQSEQRALALTETVADLVVHEVGTIEGHVASAKDSHAGKLVMATPSGSEHERFYGEVDRAGDFRVSNIPPARYEVIVLGMTGVWTVDVVSNAVTHIEVDATESD